MAEKINDLIFKELIKRGLGKKLNIWAYARIDTIKEDNLELWNDLKTYGIAFKGDDTVYYWMYKYDK